MVAGQLSANLVAGLAIDTESLGGGVLWRYSLPTGLQPQPIEPIIAGRLARDGPSVWLLPGPDGSIHILAADGRLIDRFNYGAVLQGLATVEIGGRARAGGRHGQRPGGLESRIAPCPPLSPASPTARTLRAAGSHAYFDDFAEPLIELAVATSRRRRRRPRRKVAGDRLRPRPQRGTIPPARHAGHRHRSR